MQQQSVSSEARDRVVRAAYSLFMERGYADTSMQQIADAASITKATLYHHFRDKQDLYLATMRMAFVDNQATFMEGIRGSADLRSLVHHILNFVINKHSTDMQRLMTDFHQHIDKSTQEAFWSEFPRPWLALEPIIQNCIDAGQMCTSDAAFTSRFIYSSVAGYSHMLRTVPDYSPDANESHDQFVETVLHGIICSKAEA